MEKIYDHKKVEERIYKEWEEKGYFKPRESSGQEPQKVFSMVLPPPNVTGTLHLGQALMLTIEDIIIRYQRMRDRKTLWLPGTDHAAIATNAKVEAILFKEQGKTKYDLGREKFVKMVEDFAQNSHDTIVHQMRRMGASVDWSKEAYTLDEERSLAVRTAFKRMYDEGLIYRGAKIVNWDPKLQTTVSDDEVEWKEETAPFYYFKYGPFVIGTARPETKFGDKYVVMHPSDKRYKDYKHGQKLEVEWINGTITATIIKDSAVDMAFGTGVMTITPWHDRTDFEIAERHNLDKEQIIDFKGLLLPIAGELAGQHIKKARPLIVEKLKQKGLVEKIDEKYVHRIATNSRGGGIIEPQIKEQWFVSVSSKFKVKSSKLKNIKVGDEVTLKQLMKSVVDSGEIEIVPEHFKKIYFHWIDNLRDWCISRQIWYGHRIPVWYSKTLIPNVPYKQYVGVNAPEGDDWAQDTDTLDTWFSSGLWTFSTLGWPEITNDLKTFHPTSVLETGYDILFFWVARMILMTTYLLGEVPFRTVLLHGLVRDAQKQKMSKSKGNIIDPLTLSDMYGTDALRIALVFATAMGNDIALSEDRVRGMKHFSNKLWNIGRFVEMKRVENSKLKIQSLEELKKIAKNEKDSEIIDQTQKLIKEVTLDLDNYHLHFAADKLYQFTWHEFADKYIEDVKNRIDNDSYIILNTLYIILLRLLHPFMPFVTEEIYQRMGNKDSIMISPWPKI